jgi:hypothetical protein
MAFTSPTFQLSWQTSPKEDTRLLCGGVQEYCSGDKLQKPSPLLSTAAHCASAALLQFQAGFCVVKTISRTIRARVAHEQLLASNTSTCSSRTSRNKVDCYQVPSDARKERSVSEQRQS